MKYLQTLAILSLFVVLLSVVSDQNKLSTQISEMQEKARSEPLEYFDPEEFKVNPEEFNPHPTVGSFGEAKYEWMEVEATAYCPLSCCCGEWADGVTATGTSAYTMGVAVDPKVIPLGTIIEIPNYGKVKADDVGGAIKGRRIDVRFKTHQEAREYGRQTVRIRIYK
jgi:3D (Asp-Asp-Asp) domain-containing protein